MHLHRNGSSRWILLIVAMLLTGFSGCNIKGKGPLPSYATSTLPSMSTSGETFAPDRWWTAFADAGLNVEVNRALSDNFDLAAALQRLRAAQALTRREASDLFPDVNGLLSSQNTYGPGPSNTQISVGLNAAYQVDLWGQIRSRVDAERLRTEATRLDYQTVALTLSSEIARTWFTLIEAYAQLELLDEQVETNEKGLKAVELRYAALGEGGSANVLRQRQLVQATLEQIIIAKSDIEVLEHRLAVLTGQPPQTAQYTTGSKFPELPPIPYTGLPSELLNRRPDVRANYQSMAAADQDLAAAVLDQYPRLNLTGSLINAAETPETLFRDWFLSIGGQLLGPILDGGQRRAEVDRRKALVCESFAAYRQSILIALQEVEDALALERYQFKRIEKLETQVELARKAAGQLLQYFITGEATYLDVLSANQSQQGLQRDLISARLNLILIRVGLYLAIAGEFDTQPIAASDFSVVVSEIESDRVPESEPEPELEVESGVEEEDVGLLNQLPTAMPAAVSSDNSLLRLRNLRRVSSTQPAQPVERLRR